MSIWGVWGLWGLSLLGLLLLCFKKGERPFIGILGFYGVAFWCIFAFVMDLQWFYVSAILFAVLGTYGTWGAYTQKKEARNAP